MHIHPLNDNVLLDNLLYSQKLKLIVVPASSCMNPQRPNTLEREKTKKTNLVK